MAGGVIRARLRKGKDDDIADAIAAALLTKDEADIIREALRLYFSLEGFQAPRGNANTHTRHKNTPGTRTAPPGHTKTETKTVEKAVDTDAALDGLLGF